MSLPLHQRSELTAICCEFLVKSLCVQLVALFDQFVDLRGVPNESG